MNISKQNFHIVLIRGDLSRNEQRRVPSIHGPPARGLLSTEHGSLVSCVVCSKRLMLVQHATSQPSEVHIVYRSCEASGPSPDSEAAWLYSQR